MLAVYADICERISRIEHSKGSELTEQQISDIWFYRRAMKNSLDFVRERPDDEQCGLNKNTFDLYYKRLTILLNELE